MKLLGAEVVPVHSGAKTLKDALNEAMRDWVGNVRDTFYIIGTAAGPSPYPRMVRDFNAVVGKEARAQMLEEHGPLRDAEVGCGLGCSKEKGLVQRFLAEAAGEGLASGRHAASLAAGRPGVLHGNRTYLICDDDGQVTETHSISAGLDYPGVGPEHAFLKDSGRARYEGVTDAECMEAFHLLARTEGILAALESSHAVALAMRLARGMPKDAIVLANVWGRGDKDIHSIAAREGIRL
jgi:tryptophan synthase beta chain